jgi:hypothetical protein
MGSLVLMDRTALMVQMVSPVQTVSLESLVLQL